MSIFNQLKQNNPEQVLWEEDLFFCLLDGFPVNPGHSLVIPKREVLSILDLSTEEWRVLKELLKKTIDSLNEGILIEKYSKIINETENIKSKKFIQDSINYIESNGFNPTAYNHGVNDGESAGRTVNHLHWHIIPRFDKDVDDPTGGVRFVIPDKANYRR